MYTSPHIQLQRELHMLLRHPQTAWYSGVMLHGKHVLDENIRTACTDGKDCRYNPMFVFGDQFTRPEKRFVIMHEVGHKAYRHLPFYQDYWKQDTQLANICADYVDNDILTQIAEIAPDLLQRPRCALYDQMFRGWSVPEVWRYFQTGKTPKGEDHGKPQRNGSRIEIGGKTFGGDPLDEHDLSNVGEVEEQQELAKEIETALREGQMIAGKFGIKLPRALAEVLEPVVDWRAHMAEFVSGTIKGNEEATWQRYNRKRIADEYYLPSTYKVRPTEVIVAIDTSGSISAKQIAEFTAELSAICEGCMPDRVRVLWWEFTVTSEQVFTESQYGNLRDLLKPVGGGGTRVACVSDYITDKGYNPDCVVVLTDGYVEDDISWRVIAPTLWMITQNDSFAPPAGQVVRIK